MVRSIFTNSEVNLLLRCSRSAVRVLDMRRHCKSFSILQLLSVFIRRLQQNWSGVVDFQLWQKGIGDLGRDDFAFGRYRFVQNFISYSTPSALASAILSYRTLYGYFTERVIWLAEFEQSTCKADVEPRQAARKSPYTHKLFLTHLREYLSRNWVSASLLPR